MLRASWSRICFTFFYFSDALKTSSQKTNSFCIFKILKSFVLSVFGCLWTTVWSVKKQLRLFSVWRVLCKWGHPTTVSVNYLFGEASTGLEFSITCGRIKTSRWTLHSVMHNFRSLSNKFLTVFWSLLFHISLPRLSYFSYKNGKLKFSDWKIWWR